MNKATDPVLEVLDDADMAVSINAVRFELDRTNTDAPARRTVYRAISELEARGYISRPKGEDTKLIEITDRGRAYLRGDRDARDDA